MKKVFLLLLVSVLAAVAFVVYFIYSIYFYPAQETELVYFPKGTSTKEIATELHDIKAINSKRTMMIYSFLRKKAGKILQSGEYQIEQGQSLATIIKNIESGKRYVRKITIPEGYTNFQIDVVLASAYGLVGDSSASAFGEGTFMPDTYHYHYGDSKSEILNQMLVSMKEFLDANMHKNKNSDVLRNPEEVLTMASIVERETPKKEELPIVASVYINRLKKGMKLQADPTVEYFVSNRTGMMPRKLLLEDLKLASPYNTYVNLGLPPSPIASPSRAAIMATLVPAETNYIFFVADGNGGHNFSVDYKDHQMNVKEYREKTSKN